MKLSILSSKLSLVALLALSLQAKAQTATADNCLDGQDMNAADVDISQCPPLPASAARAPLGQTGQMLNLGAYEIGTTAEGQNYKYGSLNAPVEGQPRVLSYEGGTTTVNDGNIACWAKGYYRLRKILQTPPADYMKLYEHNFQVRFFQFQTDLRNGPTGYRRISSYQDHLVKWVTIVEADGSCTQPTLEKFQAYLTSEVTRRGL